MSLPGEGLMPFPAVSPTRPSPQVEWGQRRNRDDVSELVMSHCLPYNKSLYTYLQCALWGWVWPERPVHLQTVITSRRVRNLTCGSTAWSLPLAECEACTPDFLSLVSEGNSFGIPISVLFSSPVSGILHHLRSFCTKGGQELACAHQTDVSWDSQLSLSTSKPERPLDSSCEWLSPGFSFWGAEQEWGKSLKIKPLPCELIIYFSHKCLWCTECYQNLHAVGFPVGGRGYSTLEQIEIWLNPEATVSLLMSFQLSWVILRFFKSSMALFLYIE